MPTRLVPEPAVSQAVTILDPYLAERIRSIEQGSTRFQSGMDQLRRATTPIFIGTIEQIAATLGLSWNPRLILQAPGGDVRIIGGVESSEWQAVAVRVNLRLLRHVYRTNVFRELPLLRSRNDLQVRFDRDVETVLIHEIWGHLLPVVRAGSLSAACADPPPGEPGADSCVMRREAEIRQELGLPPRTSYVLRR